MSSLLLCCLLSSAAPQIDLRPGAEPPETIQPHATQPLELADLTSTAGDAALTQAEPSDVRIATIGTSADAGGLELTDVAADADVSSTAGQALVAKERYGPRTFFRQAESIPWRLGGAAAAITLTGVANWDWGSSSFHFDREGWFGKDTASLGMDKLGHAWTTHVLTDFFADGIDQSMGKSRSSAYTGAILAMGLMTYIEVFDGFSEEHGFSHEDLLVDAAGALFSVARRTIPGMREKVDFRLLYTPSRATLRSLGCLPSPRCDRDEDDDEVARSPIQDYSNQRYLLALKLSGFERLKRTPLRLLELHGGYYARGFTPEARERGEPLRRRLFVGAGINLAELFFPGRPGPVGRAVKSGLEYLQLPYTAVHSD